MKKTKLLIFAFIALASMLLISGCNNEVSDPTLKIETPFVELEYPEKWESKIKTEWVGTDNSGSMIFSLKYNDISNVELFQVHFNEDAQIPSGVLKTEEEEIRVGLSFAEFEFDDSWSDNEKDEFYAMQEDANFTIARLSENKNFKSK